MEALLRFVQGENGKLELGGEGKLYFVKNLDFKNTSFVFDPRPIECAGDLEVLKIIETNHSFVYYGFFNPFVGDVVSQIPKNLTGKVVAFETKIEDVRLDGNLHKTKTILYGEVSKNE
ncbi:hypothetical protein HN587_03030 [Candidatus Woesearchaeota archaeon]|nr:hypothetical protein [Candidatus Woesearchaeota archaeon]